MQTSPARPRSLSLDFSLVLHAASGLLLVLGGILGAAPSLATVSQQIIVSFDPDLDPFNSNDLRSGDSISVATSGDIDRALFASVAEPGGQASVLGSVGQFGDLGTEGRITRMGELASQVVIESDEFINLTGVAQSLTANFIIDGGLFVLNFGPNATLEYTLTLTRGFADFRFQTYGILSGDANGVTTFIQGGTDIGAVFDGSSRVDIPFAFASADLGVLGPGERLELEYQLDIVATVPQFAEILTFEFSDPLDVSGPGGDFPFPMDIEMTPIPEPSSLLLLGLGLVGLGSRRPLSHVPERD